MGKKKAQSTQSTTGGELMDSPIRLWLEKKNMTQAAFAELIGVQTATVNGWCNNKNTDMKISNLVKIIEITGLSMIKVAEWGAHHALSESGWDDREAG